MRVGLPVQRGGGRQRQHRGRPQAEPAPAVPIEAATKADAHSKVSIDTLDALLITDIIRSIGTKAQGSEFEAVGDRGGGAEGRGEEQQSAHLGRSVVKPPESGDEER